MGDGYPALPCSWIAVPPVNQGINKNGGREIGALVVTADPLGELGGLAGAIHVVEDFLIGAEGARGGASFLNGEIMAVSIVSALFGEAFLVNTHE